MSPEEATRSHVMHELERAYHTRAKQLGALKVRLKDAEDALREIMDCDADEDELRAIARDAVMGRAA